MISGFEYFIRLVYMRFIQSAFLVAVENLVTRDARDAELAAHQGHLFAFKKTSYETEAFIHWLTLSPSHLGASQMQKV